MPKNMDENYKKCHKGGLGFMPIITKADAHHSLMVVNISTAILHFSSLLNLASS
jgi:hypothetical protein